MRSVMISKVNHWISFLLARLYSICLRVDQNVHEEIRLRDPDYWVGREHEGRPHTWEVEVYAVEGVFGLIPYPGQDEQQDCVAQSPDDGYFLVRVDMGFSIPNGNKAFLQLLVCNSCEYSEQDGILIILEEIVDVVGSEAGKDDEDVVLGVDEVRIPFVVVVKDHALQDDTCCLHI